MSEASRTKTVKKVCKCENCGNEAEMVVTCSLESATATPPEAEEAAESGGAPHAHETHKVKGHGVCSHCGSEADIWVDI